MTIEKLCMMFSMQEPYYGILLSSMERVEMVNCDPKFTIGVGRAGNVFKLYYNKNFIENLDVDTALEILKHETLHVAFNHFSIWENQSPSPEEQNLRNVAADMEVNGYINTAKMKGVKPVLASDFGWENYAGTREYFRRLISKAEQQAQAQQPQQPCNGGKGGMQQRAPVPQQSNNPQPNNGQNQGQPNPGMSSSATPNQQNAQEQPSSGNGGGQSQMQKAMKELADSCPAFDDHSNWPKDISEEEKEMLQQVIDDMLVFAADEVEKGRGSVPGELVGKIDELRKRRPKPVADWKRFFRRYIGNEFSEQTRKSKKRESKRFPDAAGNRHRRKSNILVAIDTSGSVSMPEYMEFFGQIKTLQRTSTFHVVECDARIQHEYDYKGKPNQTLHGGGGTDFQPVIDLYKKNRRKYEGLVYFTDGGAPIPTDTPKETLWVISSNGDHHKPRYTVNGASVVFIKPKNK